jgi:hypothetical protein
MIDEHDAERDRAGEQQGAAEEPVPGDAPSGELVSSDELDLAEDAGLGEAERALLRWAFRQRQRAPGEPLLPTGNVPPPPERPTPDPAPRPSPADSSTPTPAPRREAAPNPAPRAKPMRLWPEPTPEVAPARPPDPKPEVAPARPPDPRPEAAPSRAEDQHAMPWERLHGSAEEAISALVAAGGPDPRDYASPRLDRRTKLLIAVALAVLFVVSVLAGFVGYRVTHRAARAGPEVAGRPAGIHAAAPATRSV